MDDEGSSSWLDRLFKSNRGAVLEQEITEDAYEDFKALLMRAKPEIEGDRLHIKLPNGEVELVKGKLIVKAKSRKEAEKILRNLHHYSMPPGLWPAYGLSYSIRRSSVFRKSKARI
ncbi:PIN domain-containing protein [Thermococcus sp.]